MRTTHLRFAAAGSALLFLSVPLHAQTGRVVTAAETVPSLTEEPAVEPPRAEPMLVLQARVEALETRIERLEELVRSLTGGGVATPAVPQAQATPESGPTPGDPALATTGATEEEIQRAKAETEEEQTEQRQTAQDFDQMQDEQRQEAQEAIRNRVRNAELIDGDGGRRSGY